ncbi:MAG: hypothetical protein ACXVPC_11285 [Tumebacillaceae bacterium]
MVGTMSRSTIWCASVSVITAQSQRLGRIDCPRWVESRQSVSDDGAGSPFRVLRSDGTG